MQINPKSLMFLNKRSMQNEMCYNTINQQESFMISNNIIIHGYPYPMTKTPATLTRQTKQNCWHLLHCSTGTRLHHRLFKWYNIKWNVLSCKLPKDGVNFPPSHSIPKVFPQIPSYPFLTEVFRRKKSPVKTALKMALAFGC